ncbi:MAG: protein translocase subunit SecF [Patescibacteria group bacterium]|nr:protein translocase subunit SecF [Patescibacteria group bacterium]
MKHEKRLLLVPAVISLLAVLALVVWGLKPGIDLTGGSLLQVSYAGAVPTVAQIQDATAKLNVGEIRIQPTGQSGYTLTERALSNEEKNSLEQALQTLGPIHEDEFTSVSPTIGQELLNKGLIALALVAACIILFIAFAFRKVSKPVASWKYGVIAIITLVHDILIPTGLFALLGHFEGAEVNSLFIVALLTLLGVSINNTIVVFDRIRENLGAGAKKETFDETISRSIMQTLARSINTSLAVIIVLIALYILGPASTQVLALTLIVGMIAGTYSSIFLASPLLVAWEKWSASTR